MRYFKGKQFMLYIRKTEVLNQASVFRRAANYKIIYSCIMVSEQLLI
ncbi:hypothetical protein [Bacillus cereus]